jgi:hypothetical protein
MGILRCGRDCLLSGDLSEFDKRDSDLGDMPGED